MQQRRQSKPRARKKPAPKKAPRIRPSTPLADIAAMHPDAPRVLATYGLHCAGCAMSAFETLEEGIEAHGLSADDLRNIIDDLTELLRTGLSIARPITVTEAAAKELGRLIANEGSPTTALRVVATDSGGFCMEFDEQKRPEDQTFSHPSAPQVCVVVAAELLTTVGGAVIDFRDGRFKLDMPQTSACRCIVPA